MAFDSDYGKPEPRARTSTACRVRFCLNSAPAGAVTVRRSSVRWKRYWRRFPRSATSKSRTARGGRWVDRFASKCGQTSCFCATAKWWRSWRDLKRRRFARRWNRSLKTAIPSKREHPLRRMSLSNHLYFEARSNVKAAYIEKTGSPDVIQYGDLPQPVPQTGEVLVRVGAVAVNPIDLYIRAGIVAMPLPKPFIVGCDLAGTVEPLGPGAQPLQGRRPRLGLEPGTARPAGDVRGVCRRRRGLAVPDAGRRGRQDGRGRGAGRHHRPPRSVPRCATCKPARSSSSTAAPAASARWSCRWPRPSAPRSSPRSARRTRPNLCQQWGADCVLNYKTDDIPARVRGVHARPGRQRLVRDAARAGFPAHRGSDGAARPYDRHGRPAGPAASSRSDRSTSRDLSLYGFAMFNATAAEQRRCAEDINRWLKEGQAETADRPHFPAGADGGSPSAARGEHARQGRHSAGQSGADAVRAAHVAQQSERRPLTPLRRVCGSDIHAPAESSRPA